MNKTFFILLSLLCVSTELLAAKTFEASAYSANSKMTALKSEPQTKAFSRSGALSWKFPVSLNWQSYKLNFIPTGIKNGKISLYLKCSKPMLYDAFIIKNGEIKNPSFESYTVEGSGKNRYAVASGIWSTIKHRLIFDKNIVPDGKACVLTSADKFAIGVTVINQNKPVIISFRARSAANIKFSNNVPETSSSKVKRINFTPTRTPWTPRILNNKRLPDFSYAGYKAGREKIPNIPVIVNAANFGAIPNDGKDDAAALQKAIDTAVAKGGGAVFIPKGRYDFNVKPESLTHLEIKHPNIVLRGAGNGTDGTIFYLNNKMIYPKGWGGPAVVNFARVRKDIKNFKPVKITANAKRGDTKLKVESSANIKAGDLISILMFNPKPNGSSPPNAPGLYKVRGDALSRSMTAPLTPTKEWKNFAKWAPFNWIVEVKSVHDGKTIELIQPLRMALNMKFYPEIRKPFMNFACGIEDISFNSPWQGPYRHHLNRDVDYAWYAISMTGMKDSWVRNITINNFTMDVILNNCKNVSVRNIKVFGQAGHHGLKATGFDNLVENAIFYCERTHVCGSSGNSSGNVFRNITARKKRSHMDMHGGGFPRYNLFENIRGCRMAGAGAGSNMPHSGHGNVYWNIECGSQVRAPNDFFTGLWNYMKYVKQRSGKKATNCYKLFPKSILVGVYNPKEKVMIDMSDKDRDNQWIYIEGMNRNGVKPESIYEYQKKQKTN